MIAIGTAWRFPLTTKPVPNIGTIEQRRSERSNCNAIGVCFTEPSNTVSLASLAVSVALILSACGGGSDNASATHDPAVPTVPTAVADVVAPTAPATPVLLGSTIKSITFSWSTSSDNIGVVSYEIWRDGARIAVAPAALTTYTDSALAGNSTYTYSVRALDAAGNASAPSLLLTAKTSAAPVTPEVDTTAPTAPSALAVTQSTATSLTLSWVASTDAVGVVGYEVMRNGTSVGQTAMPGYQITGLAASTAYSLSVRAYDAAGNRSNLSPVLNATTPSVATYNITPTVTGLEVGKSLVLQNGADTLMFTSNMGSSFPIKLVAGTNYAVTVKTQPSGQSCSVANDTGTVSSGNVTNILVHCSPAATTSVTTLWSEDFEAIQQLYNNSDAGFSAYLPPSTLEISTDRTKNAGGSKGSLKGVYERTYGSTGGGIGAAFSAVPPNTNHLYIEFDAKMPGPARHGFKFLKIFGKRQGDNYANTTFGLDYTGVDFASLYAVSFGDGSDVANDTANVVLLDGTNPSWVGRSFARGSTIRTPVGHNWRSTDWGTKWHHFRVYLKFNSGTTLQNEVNDGEYYLEIDGQVYVWATKLFNRHPSNGSIDSVQFFGWTQTSDNNTTFGSSTTFEAWYDNFKITTGGFLSGPKLVAP